MATGICSHIHHVVPFGSVCIAILFQGFWNYLIQQFYQVLTITTEAGAMMQGEFGG